MVGARGFFAVLGVATLFGSAAAEEQSANSEEIVATATSLATSAERLSGQAGAFRLEGKGRQIK